jgi:hypothetical protein
MLVMFRFQGSGRPVMEGTYSIWSGTCYELTATSFLHLHVVTELGLLAIDKLLFHVNLLYYCHIPWFIFDILIIRTCKPERGEFVAWPHSLGIFSSCLPPWVRDHIVASHTALVNGDPLFLDKFSRRQTWGNILESQVFTIELNTVVP